jgi:hypothetical protein
MGGMIVFTRIVRRDNHGLGSSAGKTIRLDQELEIPISYKWRSVWNETSNADGIWQIQTGTVMHGEAYHLPLRRRADQENCGSHGRRI